MATTDFSQLRKPSQWPPSTCHWTHSFWGKQCSSGILSRSAQSGLSQWPEADKPLSAWTIGTVLTSAVTTCLQTVTKREGQYEGHGDKIQSNREVHQVQLGEWLGIFYGHVIHPETMLKDHQQQDEQYTLSTLMTQCLHYLGQFGTSMLSLECQKMTTEFRYKFGLDTFFVEHEEAEQRGHPHHAQWIKVNRAERAVDNAQQAQENPEEHLQEQEG